MFYKCHCHKVSALSKLNHSEKMVWGKIRDRLRMGGETVSIPDHTELEVFHYSDKGASNTAQPPMHKVVSWQSKNDSWPLAVLQVLSFNSQPMCRGPSNIDFVVNHCTQLGIELQYAQLLKRPLL